MGLVLVKHVRESVLELVIGERHGATAVGRVAQHRRAGLQCRERQWEDAPERRGADRHRDGCEPTPREDLGQQAAERVADDRRLLVESLDHLLVVVGDLADRLVREHLRMRVRLFGGLGVVGPARGSGRVSSLLEDFPPPVPAVGEQPKAVNEDDRLLAAGIGLRDVLHLVLGDGAVVAPRCISHLVPFLSSPEPS